MAEKYCLEHGLLTIEKAQEVVDRGAKKVLNGKKIGGKWVFVYFWLLKISYYYKHDIFCSFGCELFGKVSGAVGVISHLNGEIICDALQGNHGKECAKVPWLGYLMHIQGILRELRELIENRHIFDVGDDHSIPRRAHE